MSSLEGKSVIVTGSSSGIGLATACMFASKGSNVTVCGRDAQRLQDAVKACEDARNKAGHDNAKVISVAGDITDQAVIKDTVEKTLDAFGRLDILGGGVGKSGDRTPDLRTFRFTHYQNAALTGGPTAL
ncbi:oxidoreductase, short chain dehydrogenase/reductase family protein [Elysia marginata]|uniref:Oxidoreductase, short chain dehydrogenase/reductase family protein n=1 Tax=Elysia marginata TaxID=1093978 RepID=A0AAV4GLJ3_9GAST|nr:oxidoreductase, short chain dehydrogenase/reductase family protein [Elysia marginata]